MARPLAVRGSFGTLRKHAPGFDWALTEPERTRSEAEMEIRKYEVILTIVIVDWRFCVLGG